MLEGLEDAAEVFYHYLALRPPHTGTWTRVPHVIGASGLPFRGRFPVAPLIRLDPYPDIAAAGIIAAAVRNVPSPNRIAGRDDHKPWL